MQPNYEIPGQNKTCKVSQKYKSHLFFKKTTGDVLHQSVSRQRARERKWEIQTKERIRERFSGERLGRSQDICAWMQGQPVQIAATMT